MNDKITTITPESRVKWEEFLSFVEFEDGTLHEFDDRIGYHTEAWLGDVTYVLDSDTINEWALEEYWAADTLASTDREWVQ